MSHHIPNTTSIILVLMPITPKSRYCHITSLPYHITCILACHHMTWPVTSTYKNSPVWGAVSVDQCSETPYIEFLRNYTWTVSYNLCQVSLSTAISTADSAVKGSTVGEFRVRPRWVNAKTVRSHGLCPGIQCILKPIYCMMRIVCYALDNWPYKLHTHLKILYHWSKESIHIRQLKIWTSF